ncbi:hypothetical protein AGMMS49546_29740 [Spirochaetia bacterium]|nr:hypothetical protein AGMMS49546_29740 [Spirochaetia bacterium]
MSTPPRRPQEGDLRETDMKRIGEYEVTNITQESKYNSPVGVFTDLEQTAKKV